jgi:hypothetical protein
VFAHLAKVVLTHVFDEGTIEIYHSARQVLNRVTRDDLRLGAVKVIIKELLKVDGEVSIVLAEQGDKKESQTANLTEAQRIVTKLCCLIFIV